MENKNSENEFYMIDKYDLNLNESSITQSYEIMVENNKIEIFERALKREKAARRAAAG